MKKNDEPITTYCLYKNWRINGHMKYYPVKTIYRKLKLFYPEYQAWQRYFDIIPCEIKYSGWFIQDGLLWLPHTTLARMIKIKEIDVYKRLMDAEFDLYRYPTYCSTLPKTRYKAIWLNIDLIGAMLEIELFKDADQHAIQRIEDTIHQFEYDFHGKVPQSWCKTIKGTTIAGKVNLKKYLNAIMAIEQNNHNPNITNQKTVVHNITFKYDFFYSNLREYPANSNYIKPTEYIKQNYPHKTLSLFNGFACDL